MYKYYTNHTIDNLVCWPIVLWHCRLAPQHCLLYTNLLFTNVPGLHMALRLRLEGFVGVAVVAEQVHPEIL